MFNVGNAGIDGRIVYRNLEDPHHVLDELLRWHFAQSVLANMGVVGNPVFEHGFADKDIVKQIYEEPCGKERFGMEVAARPGGSHRRVSD